MLNSSIFSAGGCITTALPGDVCSLDSYASYCATSSASGLSVHGCSCFDFDDSSAQDSTGEEPNISCDGKNKHADM